MTRAASWLPILFILTSIFACSSQTTGAAAGGPDGPGLDQMQPLGTFDACKALVVHGKLASGGNDGVRYTGDAGLFVFDVAAPGTLSVKVEWTATAVLDVVVYNDKQQPIKAIPATTSPSMAQGPLAAGKYILGVAGARWS